MSDNSIIVEKQNLNDDSALNSSCFTSSPSSQKSSTNNNDNNENTNDISFSSSFENNTKASEFEAELSHIHNKMIVNNLIKTSFDLLFTRSFFFRNSNTV